MTPKQFVRYRLAADQGDASEKINLLFEEHGPCPKTMTYMMTH